MHSADRVRLAITSMAQQDEKTVETLYATCPRILHEDLDPEFAEMMKGIQEFVLVFALDFRPMLSKLEMLEAMGPILHALERDLPKKPRRLQTPDHSTPQAGLRVWKLTQTALAADIRAMWDAVSLICQSIAELSAETLVKAEFAPLWDRIDQFQTTWGHVARNEETYPRYCEILLALWLHCVGNRSLSSVGPQ
ncbi:MAG: hypothetical protein ACYCOU_02245 [Sulfobacillus sp.]